MVGPVSNAERSSFVRKIRLGFVAMVALSGGLVSVRAGGSLSVVVGAVVVGAAFGGVLAVVALPDDDSVDTRSRTRRR